MYLGGGLEQFDSHLVSKLARIRREHNLKKGITSYVRFGWAALVKEALFRGLRAAVFKAA
jgi:hypothetical protein